jgi:predicted transcriptional regulator
MDKIFSARVDESVIRKISMMAQELHTTKKAIIEAAIESYVRVMEEEKHIDVLERTFGAWQREETPEETLTRSRNAFYKAMKRHHS